MSETHDSFDQRWQTVAQSAARAARTGAEPVPPPGFVARVLARREPPAAGDALGLLWQRMVWRTLLGVAAVALVFAELEYHERPAPGLRIPHVERTVATALWML